MASINTIVKRKQYLWLGIVVVGAASAIGGALYLSDVDMSGNGEAVAEQEPVPDMTGVVDTTFDDKVRQHATTEMQVTAAQMQKQYEEIRRELDVLNKQRGDDQRRIEKLGQDNAALAEQVKALGANPVTATGEPVPQTPASPPGPEGEPQPGNTPVSFPPQGAVPPPTTFYPGNGTTPPPQVTYQSVPVPNRIQRKTFSYDTGAKKGPSLPYIPSGSFAKSVLIEGADANASVTGNESTVPMQLRITGLVEMPNSKTYDAMDFILDEHDQAFLRQSRIATVQIILLFIVGVVSAVVVAVKVPQFAFIILGILYGTAMIVGFYIVFVWISPASFIVLSRRKLLHLICLTEDVPDARQELLNRLLSGKKLTGRDEEDIRRLWQERQDEAEESETRQREQDAIRKFIGEDEQ